MTKADLIKIEDYLWEIPKSFRSDPVKLRNGASMRVPARIYATEKMLDEISRDRSLEQLVNVATLPGIVGYALAMPDIHEGYGFPVGGVAAFDVKEGIISPGGIGYDINCLHPDTVVALPYGTYLKIKDLEGKWSDFSAVLVGKGKRAIGNSQIIDFFKQNKYRSLYEVTTTLGAYIKVTGDHPLYTPAGMVKAEKLKVGDKIVTYPFLGAKHEPASNKTIFELKDIEFKLDELGLSNAGNRRPQIISWLEKRGLAALRYNSPQLPTLIKVLGYLFGDGTANFIGKERKGRIAFYGKKEDLEVLQRDLTKIGIKAGIYYRERQHRLTNFYQKTYEFVHQEYSLVVSSTGFLVLLHLLGAPLGNKTSQPFGVPDWIKQAPLWQQRLFSSAFFGAEMSTPATLNKFNFYAPTLNINKARPLKANGIQFLNDIRLVLKKMGVKSTPVIEVVGLSGKESTGLRFQILSNSKNLIKFFQGVGFEYNREKQKLACLAIAYLKYKEKIKTFREKTREIVRTLYKQVIPVATLVTEHQSTYTPPQFIEHSVWSPDRENPRIAFDFPSFDNFVSRYAYGDDGLVVDEIGSIEQKPYRGFVYDLAVNHPDHNFIASGIVVSNCGVRLLASEITYEEVKPHLEKLGAAIFAEVPSGVGRGGRLTLKGANLDKVLSEGAPRLVELGYGEKEDLEHLESGGVLTDANPEYVSEHAKKRGADQLGTMGAGNHFVEVEYVEQILDEKEAERLGLFPNQVTVLIHTGSRGLGHQVATDYIRTMMRSLHKYGIELVDRELACNPFESDEGQRYWGAMCAGANFAWSNRQLITEEVRQAWQEVLGKEGGELRIIYDVAHNIAKVEEYDLSRTTADQAEPRTNADTVSASPSKVRASQRTTKVVVHRKGATRAFPGQPVLIPGSMGTASYVLVGTEKSLEVSFGSSCHGAGRRMSRTAARKQISVSELRERLEDQGVVVNAGSAKGLTEEAPEAYKDVDEVVEVVHQAGIAKKVARLKPVAAIKG